MDDIDAQIDKLEQTAAELEKLRHIPTVDAAEAAANEGHFVQMSDQLSAHLASQGDAERAARVSALASRIRGLL